MSGAGLAKRSGTLAAEVVTCHRRVSGPLGAPRPWLHHRQADGQGRFPPVRAGYPSAGFVVPRRPTACRRLIPPIGVTTP